MNLLINITDFEEYKHLTQNLDASDIDPLIFEAQEFDLCPILGAGLYNDMLTNITNYKYRWLLEGQIYTPVGGTASIIYRGLKPVLIYYTYARMLVRDGVKSTNAGFLQKELENSERISNVQRTLMINQARSGAKKYEDDMRAYLDNYQSTYPLWRCTMQKNKGTGFRMRAV